PPTRTGLARCSCLADQDRDAVHGIGPVSLRIPVAGDVRLHHPARVRGPRPYLVVAVARQLQGRRPALPVIAVLRPAEAGALPAGAEVDRHVDRLDRVVAGPCGAAQLQLPAAGRELGAVRRIGDDRAHRHGFQVLEVARIGLAAGHHRVDGDPIRGAAHALAVVHLVAYPDAGEPLAGYRARPAADDEAQGEAVDQLQRLAVHRPDDEVVLVHQLLDGDAARQRALARIAREVRVGAVVAAEDGRWFEARGPQHVGHAHPGPLGTAGPAVGPLVAARLGRKERAPIAAAFQHHALRHRLEPGLELAQRQLELLVDLAVDDELPLVRFLGRLGYLAVVADVEPRCGRRL